MFSLVRKTSQKMLSSTLSLGFSVAFSGTLIAAPLLLTGCESGEDRSMASAQSCLDSANNEAAANVCVAKVAGLTTPASYLIRCSAHFIAQGFTGDRIASAYQRMTDSSSSGTDPVTNIMAYLVFTNTSALHTIDLTVSDCTQAEVESMQRLSLVAQLATSTATLTASLTGLDLTHFDPTNPAVVTSIESAITQATNLTAPQKAQLGQVALNLNSSFCGAGSSMSSNDVCVYMNSAISGTDGTPAAVADAFFALLKQKNGH